MSLKDVWKKIHDTFTITTEIENIKKSSDVIYDSLTNLTDNAKTVSKDLNDVIKNLQLCNHASMYNEAISNATNCLLWYIDLNGVIVSINDNMKHSLNYFKNVKGLRDYQLLEMYKKNFKSCDAKILTSCFMDSKNIIVGNKTITNVERGGLFGKECILRIRKSIVRDSSGRVMGICGIADDITTIVNILEKNINRCKNEITTNDLKIILSLFLDDQNDNIRR